jgi:hypothetical protein
VVAFVFFLFQVTHLIISLFIDKVLAYQGFFAYPETLKTFGLPKFIYSLANFDGVYYLKIAKDGYYQFEQAFFPLYPLLIKLTTFLTQNYLISGLLISNLCFLFGLFLFKKYLKKINQESPWVLAFLLLFPTSFFFITVYTESLFFVFLILFFYFFSQKKYFLAAIFGFFASLTRINGVLLTIPFLILIYKKIKDKKISLTLFLYPLITVLGLTFYMVYLLKTTGDPLLFLNSQKVFGANRSTTIIFLPQVYFRYLKIFFTASFNFQHFVAVLEFFIFNLVFLVLILDLIWVLKKKNQNLLALNLFSVANLILPTLTGTFSSITRYSLLSLSFFLFLSRIKSKAIKIILSIIFSTVHLILFGFYLQGYFIG